jgi:ABC-type phosphate transport system substrate-binding protein
VRRIRIFGLLLALLAASSLAEAKQLAIIADTANPTTNVTAADLAKIFNGHLRNWPDGKPITIVVRDVSSADMQPVLRKLLNMTTEQAKQFVDSHHGVVVVADSDDAVIHFVSTNRGAIGVVDLYSLTKGVNVVKVNGKLPVEQGYLLRGN